MHGLGQRCAPVSARGGGNRRGRASAASRSRYAGECPLFSATTTVDTGALRTEPPLCVIASAVSLPGPITPEITASY